MSIAAYATAVKSSVGSLINPYLNQGVANPMISIPQVHYDRDLDRVYHTKIRPILDAIDNLRAHLGEESSIKVPSIVVLGDQSSGKSSVLEGLSGVSLPRGQEITTRCPLILRLININNAPTHHHQSPSSSTALAVRASPSAIAEAVHVPSPSHGQHPFAVISLSPASSPSDERIDDLEMVGDKITQYTAKLAGSSVGVSDCPIYLSVYRANSPDLTLIDLPGITRFPVNGQPTDIYQQIKKMIFKFISSEETIILNVMNANNDFATNEGVVWSQEVDPAGVRSIGVITKCDLAEAGIKRKLNNALAQLNMKMGLVLVRNRTHEENERRVEWEVAREMEKQFFQRHPELSDFLIPPTNLGGIFASTASLAVILGFIQEEKIKAFLPKIKTKVKDLLIEKRETLKLFPSAISSVTEARLKIDQLLNNLISQLTTLSKGDHAAAKGNLNMHMSPRMLEFYKKFQQSIVSANDGFLTSAYAATIQDEIKENSGICLSNFMSSQVFKALVNKELLKYNTPSHELIDQSRSLILTILKVFVNQLFGAFPSLSTRMMQSISLYMDQINSTILSRWEELLSSEDQVFTLNSYYTDSLEKLKEISALIRNPKPEHFVKVEGDNYTVAINDVYVKVKRSDFLQCAQEPAVLEMQMSCYSYLNLAQKRMVDNLILLVRYHFINKFITYQNGGLYEHIRKDVFDISDKTIMEMMKEEPSVATKREKLASAITALEKASHLFESF